MKLDEKLTSCDPVTRKRIGFALALAAVIAFLMMPPPSSFRRVFSPAPQSQPRKPSPFRGSAAVPAPADSPEPVAIASSPMPATLPGTYAGKGVLPTLGVCTCQLELRGQEGRVVGYSTLQCTRLGLLMPGARPTGAKPITPEEILAATGRLTPVASVLSGAWEDGGVQFHVDKTIGARDGCVMDAATVTPFGSNQVGFEFHEEGGACSGGHLLLRKAGP